MGCARRRKCRFPSGSHSYQPGPSSVHLRGPTRARGRPIENRRAWSRIGGFVGKANRCHDFRVVKSTSSRFPQNHDTESSLGCTRWKAQPRPQTLLPLKTGLYSIARRPLLIACFGQESRRRPHARSVCGPSTLETQIAIHVGGASRSITSLGRTLGIFQDKTHRLQRPGSVATALDPQGRISPVRGINLGLGR